MNPKTDVRQGPTIGVFDSGFGGLTVLRALLPLIPDAHYLYLGDTARLPYGSKSPETIARYATTAARFLQDRGAQLLVIACNTASALAMDQLNATATVPVIGVIEPGAAAAGAAAAGAAAAASLSAQPAGSVLVLATSATVQSNAYARACAALGLATTQKACPLLVPLVEEGWIGHSVTSEVLRIYLKEALDQAAAEGLQPASLLLGCTHYPLLRDAFQAELLRLSPHRPIRIVDSADATASAVAARLSARPDPSRPATCAFFATDSVAKFQTLGARFLGRPIDHVEHIDLGG